MDKTTGAYDHASIDSADRIDMDNIVNCERGDLIIRDGFKMNDASTIIGQELQVDKGTHKQTNNSLEGVSKKIGEQMTIEGLLKAMEELMTMTDQAEIDILCGYDGARREESNPEKVEIDDGSIGYEFLSANCHLSDSSVKASTKCVKNTSKKV